MAKGKIVHSVSIPKEWSDFIKVAMKWLQDNGYRHGKPVFVYHVYIEGLKLFAEKIGYDLSTANGYDVEFMSADNIPRKKNKEDARIESQLCNILSTMDMKILDKYLWDGFQESGMTVFEFCDQEGIDWKKLLRDDNTNKRAKE